jgi:ABC-type phosphate/phosphonate transport system permease subunit
VKEIVAFLSKEFGIVSEEAKKKVEELIREMGVFRFTLAMMKTLPVFQRDLVYHFLKEVEQARDDL